MRLSGGVVSDRHNGQAKLESEVFRGRRDIGQHVDHGRSEMSARGRPTDHTGTQHACLGGQTEKLASVWGRQRSHRFPAPTAKAILPSTSHQQCCASC